MPVSPRAPSETKTDLPFCAYQIDVRMRFSFFNLGIAIASDDVMEEREHVMVILCFNFKVVFRAAGSYSYGNMGSMEVSY